VVRIAAKVDGNQPEIVAAFEGCGCTVEYLHRLGKGCPDLLVGVAGVNLAVEVKIPGEDLNDEQKAWHKGWRGQSCVIRTVEEVVRLVKAVRAWKGVAK
jgi:hypothetical protein